MWKGYSLTGCQKKLVDKSLHWNGFPEYEQPPRAVNDIAIDTHMQTRNDGSRSPESTHDLHDVVADAHAVSLVTVTATCEKDMPPFPSMLTFTSPVVRPSIVVRYHIRMHLC